MTDVVTLGETMVSLASDGPLTIPGTLTARAAGAESNVAVGLARLGHSARWVSRVGDDAYGREVLKQLRGEGVDVTGVTVDPARPTGLMIAEARTADVTAVTYYRAWSAASAISPDDVGRLGPAQILHVTGITASLSRSAYDTVRAAVALPSYSRVSLDVNHRAKLIGSADLATILRPLLPHLSLVIGSPDELHILADDGAPELAERGLEVVEKRGAEGAALWTARDGNGDPDVYETPAAAVTAVDTISAGDAFTAGYLSALLDNLAPTDRLVRATKVAGFCVSTRGDYTGLPTRAELDRAKFAPGSALR